VLIGVVVFYPKNYSLSPILLLPSSHLLFRYLRSLEFRGLIDDEAIRNAARGAYNAFSAALAESAGSPFLFGSTPSSADAALFGHLCSVRQSPALVALIAEVAPSLITYWSRLRENNFAAVMAKQYESNVFQKAEIAAEARAAVARGSHSPTPRESFSAAVDGATLPHASGSDAAAAQRADHIRTIVATLAIFSAASAIGWRAMRRGEE
jgi:hypothetical protein